ncbi:hypothetical protein TSUD_123160 [Trifolium subterraneum]|uniref:Nodule-specific Glycine Rich Peptide n=1 Tax=Trifolium subterraneum TaxID=3900 RepID=A0A2Z6MU35_TRISU|nr:hypothetical protein TSUD_123160 [Trifolium subterraneum]
MKTKHFILLCFFALLLIFVVPIEPSKDVKKIGETEESKTSIGVDCYAYWSGRNAIWKGGEDGKNERCGGGKGGGGGGGKGFNTLMWKKVKSRGTEWWKGGKGSGNRNVGGGGYVQPIPGGGNGVGGGNVKNIPNGVNEGGSGKGDNG